MGQGLRSVAARPCSAAAASAPQADSQQPASNAHQAPAELRTQQQQHEPSQFEQLLQHARLTHIAQVLCGQVLRPGDTAVDATCGNGHDTAFLAASVGSSGVVHAFDVQAAAIEATQLRVAESVPAERRPALRCHLASHADMLQLVGSSAARVVMFNLGYLPGGDKATTTRTGSTLAAVKAACEVLQPGALCSILCYTGHPGGRGRVGDVRVLALLWHGQPGQLPSSFGSRTAGGLEELGAVKALVAELPPSEWVSSETRLLNRPTAPVLLLLWKRP